MLFYTMDFDERRRLLPKEIRELFRLVRVSHQVQLLTSLARERSSFIIKEGEVDTYQAAGKLWET